MIQCSPGRKTELVRYCDFGCLCGRHPDFRLIISAGIFFPKTLGKHRYFQTCLFDWKSHISTVACHLGCKGLIRLLLQQLVWRLLKMTKCMMHINVAKVIFSNNIYCEVIVDQRRNSPHKCICKLPK